MMERSRVILEATIEDSVIRGTLTGPSGARRRFYGWLEFNAAVEAALNGVTATADDETVRPDQLKRR
jgi:hypothetical protein